MVSLFAGGCFGSVSRPSCSEDRTPVADDLVTSLGTADDLLATTSGPRAEPAELEDGTAVTATVEVTRGDGSAEWVDREPDSIVTKTWGPGHSVLTIAVFCVDSLEIPAVGSLATDDGSFDVALDGTLTTGGSAVASDGPSFDATAPFDESGFPAPDEPELDTFENQHAFLQVAYLGDGTTSGRAGWSGDREDGDISESRAHYQIEW
ncbi:MAG: hypothetical protein ABMA64_30835 [Myxococcota bacterium]